MVSVVELIKNIERKQQGLLSLKFQLMCHVTEKIIIKKRVILMSQQHTKWQNRYVETGTNPYSAYE